MLSGTGEACGGGGGDGDGEGRMAVVVVVVVVVVVGRGIGEREEDFGGVGQKFVHRRWRGWKRRGGLFLFLGRCGRGRWRRLQKDGFPRWAIVFF